MAKNRYNRKMKPHYLKIGEQEIVVLERSEYERLLDESDAGEALRIAEDSTDRILKWKDIKDDFTRNRIATVRKKTGLTQGELARKMRVKQSTISRIEGQDSNLTIGTIRKAAKALKCSVHDLIG